MILDFRSNGKLLISGEYLVLTGANSLAIPTKYGQNLIAKSNAEKRIHWESFVLGESVLKAVFSDNGEILSSNDSSLASGISKILKAILNIKNANSLDCFNISAELDFPMIWGLGSSSTLINNLSLLYDLNPFELLNQTFGGSGYDIACAKSDEPINYQLVNKVPQWEKTEFSPLFRDKIFFIYLNRKMNSRKALELFNERKKELQKDQLERISQITLEMQTTNDIEVFGQLMMEHEQVISDVLGLKTVKEIHFNDYANPIKSLGAWGGDFIMVLGDREEMVYFRERGFETILSFDEMIYSKSIKKNEGSSQ